ncbi:MAG: ABC transporter permease [Micromonosporaceae bacterium]
MSGDGGPARAFGELMLVARRDLAVRVRGTAFRVSTIILLVATVAGIAIPAALIGRTQRFTVAVTAQAPPAVAAAVRADGNAAGLQVRAVRVADRPAAVREVDKGRVTVAVAAGGEIIWKGRPNSTLNPVLNAAVQQAVIAQRAASLGLSADATFRLLAPVRISVTQLHSQSQRTARTIIANIGIVLMYIAIAVYGGYVLTGVVEEKSSRVVEVLLSRLRPSSLLGGKIVGIGLAALAQFAAVAAAAAATLLITRPSGLPPGTYAMIPALVLWFVLGYAFYSVLHGSLGALASRTEDAQAAAGPVMGLLVGIYVLAYVAMANPGAGWVTVLSMLPPSAPMIMPLRAAMVYVPAWQVAVAVVLMLAGIYGLARVGARLYQNAVLHTGARLHLREAWRGESGAPQPAGR